MHLNNVSYFGNEVSLINYQHDRSEGDCYDDAGVFCNYDATCKQIDQYLCS